MKLYFCTDCGILIGRHKPHEDQECENCANDTFVAGEFEEEAADALLNSAEHS